MIVGSPEMPTNLRSLHRSVGSVHGVKSVMQALGTPWRTNNFIYEIVRGQGGSSMQFFDLEKWYHFYADEKLKSVENGKPLPSWQISAFRLAEQVNPKNCAKWGCP
jgi:hypothetical protein